MHGSKKKFLILYKLMKNKSNIPPLIQDNAVINDAQIWSSTSGQIITIIAA